MRSRNYFTQHGAAKIIATSLMLLAFVAAGFAQLARVGPVDPFDGFPQWYQDKNGIALEHCIPNPAELAAGLCLLLPGNMTFPVVFPTNYPGESFYFAADASIALPGGATAKLVIGHEGAFATGAVVPGDQIAFSRVRFVVDIPQPGGNYKIISPYLEKDFSNVPPGKRAIFFTEDVGLAPGDFTASLNGRVAPYLRPSAVRGGDPLPFIVVDGKSYIGDAATLAPVTGSPLGVAQNVFRIEGPNIGGPGINFIETELFTVMGRVHTAPIASPTTIDRATYVRDANSGWIDVFATATPGVGKPDPALSVGAGTISPAVMAKSLPKFYGQLTLANPQSVPPTVTVTNNADVPPSVFTATLVDEVNIRRAEYDGTAHRLTIQADSGDKIGSPILVLDGAHPAALDSTGLLIVDDLIVPAPYVTIRSSLGGSATSIVSAPASFAASPSLLTGTAISDAQVQLNWTDTSTNETGFRIDRALDSAFTTGVQSFTVPANTTAYVDNTVAGNTNYFYRVIAFTAVGASGPSNVASVSTPNPTLPPTVTNPGNRVGALAQAASLQIVAADHPGGNNLLAFSASGLPTGLTINPTSGLISGVFQSGGSFNVIVTVTNGLPGQVAFSWNVVAPPSGILASPAAGSGRSQVFQFTYREFSGFGNIVSTRAIINTTFAVSPACAMKYVALGNTIAISSDAGGFGAAVAVGSSTILQNAECSLDVSGSSVSGSGTDLVLTLPISFKPAYAGAKNIYLWTDNKTGVTSGFELRGTWTIPTPLPASVTFAPQLVGTTSAPKVLTLSNPSPVAMPISGISITGLNPTNFAQTNDCGLSINPGGSCSLSVTVKPKAAVALSAVLVVGGIQNVALIAQGVAPQAALSPASLTFAPQRVGTTSAPQIVTLSNGGSAPLPLTSIAIGGTNSTNFAQTNNCGTSVAAGGSCAITVTMTPKAAVALSATVVVTHSAGSQSAALSGSGTQPSAVLSPTSLTFAPQLVGTTSAPQTLTLSNPGIGALGINSIAIGGANTTNFAQTNNCGASLPQGASCSITVTMTPKAAVALAATVVVNDAIGTQSVALAGSGIAPKAVVSPTSLTFAPLPVGVTSPAQIVTLSNTGTAPLTINSITIAGANVTNFAQTNNCGGTLATGASCSISVTMRPRAAVPLSATVAVNDSVGIQLVTLAGAGQ